MPNQQEEESGNRDSVLKCFFGMVNSSSEAVVVTERGSAIKTRAANVRRILGSERWDTDRILGVRAVPWSPDGSDNSFDIQVGMGRPAEVVRLSPPPPLLNWRSADGGQSSEDLPSQSRLRAVESR